LKEQGAGKSRNEVLKADKVSNAYEEIKEHLGIELLMINSMPHKIEQ